MNRADMTGEPKGRILIVDDTPANLHLLLKMLTDQGYAVHPAASGTLALRFVQSILPDLVLLDIVMPGLDGYEVCERLKAEERTRDIPVIFISSADQVLDKVKAFSIGGVDYIVKPFQTKEVLARVATHLSLRNLQKRLEERVQERTAELLLANARLNEEIAEHKRTLAALHKSEEQIRTSLREKEALLKEVHHRVKNNLQIISSLLSLQATQIKDSAVVNIFTESQNRVRAMALVHESLYHSGTLAHIKLAPHVETLCALLYHSYGVDSDRITLQLRVADVSLDLDRAVPFGLIINELVSNALKHAFPGGRTGCIVVELYAQPEGRYTLSVADDGVGLPDGLDYRDTESLGLQLVGDLTHQLGGTLERERTSGTAFRISFSTEPDRFAGAASRAGGEPPRTHE